MALPGLDGRETAFVLVGCSLAAVNVVWAARRACTLQALQHFKEAAVAIIANCLRSFAETRPGEEDKEIERLVTADVEQQKIARCLRIGQVLCLLCLFNTIQIVRSTAAKAARAQTDVQEAAFFGAYASFLCMQILPSVASRFFVDLYYSAAMGCILILISPWATTDQEDIFRSIGYSKFVILLLNVWSPSLPVAALWTGGAALAACATLRNSDALTPDADGLLRALVLFEIVSGFISVFVGRLLDSSMRAETRARVVHEATREVHSAACALLRSFCDVVVELDAEGRITSDGYTVGGFLLRGCSLKGLRFDSLLSNEEGRDAILKKLSTPRLDGGSLADVIRVNARDGNGQTLPMEAFWFDYKGVGGQFRCLVGLRRSVGSGGALPDSSRDHLGEQEVYAEILPGVEGFPITFHSAGFGINIDSLPKGAPLTHYVAKNEGAFSRWIQRTTGTLLMGDSSDSDALRGFHLVLQTRKGRTTATVTLALCKEEEDEEVSDLMEQGPGTQIPPMRLNFSNIHTTPPDGIREPRSRKVRRRLDSGEGSDDSGGTLRDQAPRRQQLGTRRQPSSESYGDLSGGAEPFAKPTVPL